MEGAKGKIPWSEMRPCVGFRLVSAHAADGYRIEPPVSVPSAAAHIPAATATPEPLDEIPDQRPIAPGIDRSRDTLVVRHEGALGHLRLADEHGAGRLESIDDVRVLPGRLAPEHRRARPRRLARDVAEILDRDRNSVERAERLARRLLFVETSRGLAARARARPRRSRRSPDRACRSARGRRRSRSRADSAPPARSRRADLRCWPTEYRTSPSRRAPISTNLRVAARPIRRALEPRGDQSSMSSTSWLDARGSRLAAWPGEPELGSEHDDRKRRPPSRFCPPLREFRAIPLPAARGSSSRPTPSHPRRCGASSRSS